MPPQDVYAKLLLLSAGRGYPLWTPQPSNELLMERPEGLAIGDVGVVLDNGGFDVFFNICLPPDHPFHRFGVPQGFTCIPPGELEIGTIVDAEPLGHVISSSSIKRETFGSSSDVSNRHDSDTLPYIFNLSSSEGALLVLPKGAERCDLLNEDLFLEQASRHGADWYNYAVNRRRRIISPDSLYLITGIHKTLAWSVAAFENATGSNHTAHFKQIEGNNHAPTYRWETTTCALDWRVGPRINYDIPNQSVFIRGFKIAIRSGFLGTRISVEADVPSTRSNHVKWTGVAPSSPSTRGRSAGFLGLFSSSSGNNVSTTNPRSERTVDAAEERLQSDHDGTHVEIQRIPGPFHPSDAINRYLLDKDPSANIAITHDNHWISLLEDDLVTQEFGHESFLATVLSQNYHTVSREGVVYLERKLSRSTSRSTSEKKPATITIPQSSATCAQTLEADVDLRDSEMGSVYLSDDGADVECDADGLDQRPSYPVSLPISPSHQFGFDTTQNLGLLAPLHPHVHDNSLDSGNLEWGVDLLDPLLATLPTTQSRGELLDPTDPTMSVCMWTDGDMFCNNLIARDITSVRRHLRDAHNIRNIASTQVVACAWEGCGKHMKRESIVRHMVTCHLRIKVLCPSCGKALSRADVRHPHTRVCKRFMGPTEEEQVGRETAGPDDAQVGNIEEGGNDETQSDRGVTEEAQVARGTTGPVGYIKGGMDDEANGGHWIPEFAGAPFNITDTHSVFNLLPKL